MKLKYYLRGLGIGITVCALMLSITHNNKNQMSDAEIISRAKEIGMIENTKVLQADDAQTDNSNTNDLENVPTEEILEEPKNEEEQEREVDQEITDLESGDVDATKTVAETEISEPSQEVIETSLPDKTELDTNSNSAINPTQDETAQSSTEVKYKTVVIVKGDSSYSVSKKIQEAGLVTSAKDLDRFLCDNGYDKVLRVGSHEIPLESTFDEIGKALTK